MILFKGWWNSEIIPVIEKVPKASEKVPKAYTLFHFTNVDEAEVLKEIVRLDASKASQGTDVPTKII